MSLSGWTPENLLGLIAIFATWVSFCWGLYEYGRQQRWQRTLQLTERIEATFANHRARTALMALEWIQRDISLDSDAAQLLGSKTLKFNASMLEEALAVPFFDTDKLEIVYLRDCFDELCRNIAIWQSFAQSNLIPYKDYYPLVGYYCTLLSDENMKGQSVHMAFWGYVNSYYSSEEVGKFIKEVSNVHPARRRYQSDW
tara:strand:+ start:705 stop:1301 length:597 start_codon:yes stop_codon:yes gene_type:complete